MSAVPSGRSGAERRVAASSSRLPMTLCWIVLLAFARSAFALQPPATVDTVPAAWRRQPMPWLSHAGQPRPWRDDKRLTPYFAPGYPDDVQVIFANPDTTADP